MRECRLTMCSFFYKCTRDELIRQLPLQTKPSSVIAKPSWMRLSTMESQCGVQGSPTTANILWGAEPAFLKIPYLHLYCLKLVRTVTR